MLRYVNMKEILTHEKLKELIEYNPETGIMNWIVNRPGIRSDGIVGYVTSQGYVGVELLGRKYYIHRLIWFYVTGSWPTHVMDHRNGNRADNRWSNLREATLSENSRNRSMLRKNKTGYKGVRRRGKNVWIARIGGLHGIGQETIGRFDSPEAAAKAYEEESQRRYGNFSITARQVVK